MSDGTTDGTFRELEATVDVLASRHAEKAELVIRLQTVVDEMLAALQGAMVVMDTIPWPQDMTEKLEEALVKRREAVIAAIRKAERCSPSSTRREP